MNELDKWSAEAVGVKVKYIEYAGEPKHRRYDYYFTLNGEYYEYPWTLDDARCMEIFRECYGLTTDRLVEGTWSCFPRAGDHFVDWLGKGKTIKEAELACCKAIYEAKNEKI